MTNIAASGHGHIQARTEQILIEDDYAVTRAWRFRSLTIWDPQGRLVWDGPVLLAGALAGKPQGFLNSLPGDAPLEMLY